MSNEEFELDSYGALVEVPVSLRNQSVRPLQPTQRRIATPDAQEDLEAEKVASMASKMISSEVSTTVANVPPTPRYKRSTCNQRKATRQGIALAIIASAIIATSVFIQHTDHAPSAAASPPVVVAQHSGFRPIRYHHKNRSQSRTKRIHHTLRNHQSIVRIKTRQVVQKRKLFVFPHRVVARVSASPQALLQVPPRSHVIEHAPKILRFDAMPEHIYVGQYSTICIQIIHAFHAHISGIPQHTRLDPRLLNCMIVSPRKTTTYAVLARNHHGSHIYKSLTLVVRPKLNFTFDMLARPRWKE